MSLPETNWFDEERMNNAAMKTPDNNKPTLTSLMRSKTFSFSKKAHRRMSCRDIGDGDCNGWLMKKVQRPLRDKWTKYWFVLKGGHLYYYKDPDDDSYMGRFNLAGFIVSPADSHARSNKHAFRVHHQEHGSYFLASDRQQDMAKWMNHIIAATSSITNSKENGYHSSEEEDLELNDSPFGIETVLNSLRESSEVDFSIMNQSATATENPCPVAATEPTINGLHGDEDDLTEHSQSFRNSFVGIKNAIEGARSNSQRKIQRLTNATAAAEESSSLPNASILSLVGFDDRRRYLLALQRTLKDKELQLVVIDDLLRKTPIDSQALKRFKELNMMVANTLSGDTVAEIDASFSGV